MPPEHTQHSSCCYLGLDLGTSSLKVVMIDEAGSILAETSEDYPTSRPNVGWSEQDPADWCRAISVAVERLRCTIPDDFSALKAVSLCSAAHLPVLLDRDDEVIRPAILWNDQRSVVQAERLDQKMGQLVRERTMNEPTCTWSLPQLMWISETEPENMQRAATLLSSKDYIAFLLTGVKAMDITAAAATLMLDVKRSEWSPELTAQSGLESSGFPPIVRSDHTVGHVGNGTQTFGLPIGLPVLSGCLDSAAELVACGVADASDGAIVRVGSSGALLAAGAEGYVPGVMSYPLALNDGRYWQAGTNCGAIALQWIRDMGNSVTRSTAIDFAALDRAVMETQPNLDAIIFHPYLQGERAPYWNPDLRAGFTGINRSHQWPHFVRAVMEGVAFSLRDCLSLIEEKGGRQQRITLAGGITHSKVWSQIVADVLQRPLMLVKNAESSYGAALIARGPAWPLSSSDEVAMIDPNPDHMPIYSELFERYRHIALQQDKQTRMVRAVEGWHSCAMVT